MSKQSERTIRVKTVNVREGDILHLPARPSAMVRQAARLNDTRTAVSVRTNVPHILPPTGTVKVTRFYGG